MASEQHPAVFLDRDDTLIENRRLSPPLSYAGDLCDPARVVLIDGVAEGCAMLRRAGYGLVVVSNQGLVARGHGTIADVEATNRRMVELLESAVSAFGNPDMATQSSGDGTRPIFDAIYYCPYHPGGVVEPFNREHPWRKPAPGMILHAAREHDLDLARSWMVGDSSRDVEAGVAAGIPPPRCLRIGEGQQFTDLLAVARHIIAAT